MKCQRNVNSILPTQLPHKFSYTVAILTHNHFEPSNTFNNKNFIYFVDVMMLEFGVVFLVFSILMLVFINWLFYHIRTDIAVNAATTNSVSCKLISRKILKL
jgi:hypothetical protein